MPEIASKPAPGRRQAPSQAIKSARPPLPLFNGHAGWCPSPHTGCPHQPTLPVPPTGPVGTTPTGEARSRQQRGRPAPPRGNSATRKENNKKIFTCKISPTSDRSPDMFSSVRQVPAGPNIPAARCSRVGGGDGALMDARRPWSNSHVDRSLLCLPHADTTADNHCCWRTGQEAA